MKQYSSIRNALITLALILMISPALAQQGQGRRGGMTEEDYLNRVERLADTLDMTDKQEKELMDYEKKFYKTMQAERENFDPETGDREAMRAKMTSLRDEREAKYKSVLTDEQFTLYRKIMDQRRSDMQRRRGGPGEGSGGDRGRGRGRGG